MAQVKAQYEDDSYNEIDDDVDEGNAYLRETRSLNKISPYAYIPPSRSCARASFGRSYCGGFSAGNKGGCDTYCENIGYGQSYCFPTYCLCHRGVDFGKECTNEHRN